MKIINYNQITPELIINKYSDIFDFIPSLKLSEIYKKYNYNPFTSIYNFKGHIKVNLNKKQLIELYLDLFKINENN